MFFILFFCFLLMYLFSKSILSLLVSGIMKFPSTKERDAKKNAVIINGRNNLEKLIPEFSIAIISLLPAILDVKYITDMNMKSGLKRFPK